MPTQRSRADRHKEFERWVREEVEMWQQGIVDFWYGELFDAHDPYASVMGTFFEVAELLDAEGARIPSAWQYDPGASRSRSPREQAADGSSVAEVFLDGTVTLEDVRDLGDFLNLAYEKVRELHLNY